MKNMIQRRLVSGFVITSLLASSTLTYAQSSPAPQGSWAAVQAIKPNSEVMVVLKNGTGSEGKLRSVSNTAIVIVDGKASTEIQRENILAISTSRKSVKKSTLIGAAVGAGAGGALGTVICGSGGLVCTSRSQGAANGALIFASLGALVGFLVGEGKTKQVVIYSAKP